jgi:hypothetical protein
MWILLMGLAIRLLTDGADRISFSKVPLVVMWPEEIALFYKHQQRCGLGKRLFLFLLFTLQPPILTN